MNGSPEEPAAMAPRAALRGRTVLYVGNVDWFFISHRRPLAVAAARAGCRVIVATADTGVGTSLKADGVAFEALPMARVTGGLRGELRTVSKLRRLIGRTQPDLIHAVGHKAILHAVVGRAGVSHAPLVQAVSGMGSALLHEGWHPARAAIGAVYGATRRDPRAWTIFQNTSDHDTFLARRWAAAERSAIIAGSGVDCDAFRPPETPPGETIVLLPARMLADKGIREYVAAARMLSTRYPGARFVLAGSEDPANPSAIARDEIEEWVSEGIVEWWGHRPDMRSVYPRAAVVALPSYREGLSKALIEAAACGRAIVTTDVPGCREVVDGGRSGVLVPARDAEALAAAIASLLDDPTHRERLGHAARTRAEQQYDIRRVVDETLELYERALTGSAAR
ncbi:MAG: glycosyltransferase family 4 protein [Longimicrobiales bacterium]